MAKGQDLIVNDKVVMDMRLFIAANDTVVFVESKEEARAIEHITKAVQQFQSPKREVVIWSLTRGFQNGPAAGSCEGNPGEALQKIIDEKDTGAGKVYIFLDLHTIIEQDMMVRRLLRDVARAFAISYNRLFCVSGKHFIPEDMDTDVRHYRLPLPEDTELDQLIRKRCIPLLGTQCHVENNDDTIDAIVRSLLGMTMLEAEAALSRAVVAEGELSMKIVPNILTQKKEIIARGGLVEFHTVEESLEDIGGYDELKDWISARGKAQTKKAREFGLPAPKGILLLGVQGCGKSLAAKAVAASWNMPLLKLDMGRVMGSLVGQSEKNITEVLEKAEAVSPCVFYIDELEKALSGMGQGSGGDSGTSSRVGGKLLTWMQEHTKPVFVIATANRVDHLPPELLRKGRFDEIFFVDLPNFEERKEIIRIHLKRRGRNPKDFKIKALARHTEGFSGAEIEQAVISAMFSVYDARKEDDDTDISTADILKEVKRTYPLSKTMAESVNAIRVWAKQRARAASRPVENLEDEEAGTSGKKSKKATKFKFNAL